MRIEALRDELLMVFTPLIFVMMQHSHQKVNFIASSYLQLLWCTFGKNDVFRYRVWWAKWKWRFYSHRLSETHHGVFKIFLNLFIGTGILKKIMIYMLTIAIPSVECQKLVNLWDKLLFDVFISVHVDILDQIIDSNLSSGYCSDIDYSDIIDERLIGIFFKTVDITAFIDDCGKKIHSYISFFYLLNLFLLLNPSRRSKVSCSSLCKPYREASSYT